MKKIVFFNTAYYPWIGGTERVTQRIAEYCANKNCEVYVFSGFPKHRKINELNNVKIYEYKNFISSFYKVLKIKPDIIFCNILHNRSTIEIMRYSFLLKHFFKNAKFIINPVGGYLLKEKRRIKLLKKANKVFDYYIHADDKNLDYTCDIKYISKEKLKIIPQGLDSAAMNSCIISKDKFDLLKNKYGVTFDNYFVCACGFFPWKNHYKIINFFMSNNDYNLVLMGSDKNYDAEYLKNIKKIIKDVNNIKLLQGLPDSEFIQMIYFSLGVVSSSNVEGPQNNVMLECLYYGIPYISTPATQNYSYFPHCIVYNKINDLEKVLPYIKKNNAIIKENNRKEGIEYIRKNKMTWNEVLKSYYKLFGLGKNE